MATDSTPQQMTAEQVLHLIAQHLAKTGMSETRFCREAVNDPRLIGDLRAGRQPRAAITARVLAYIEATPPVARPRLPATAPVKPVTRSAPAPAKAAPTIPSAKLWPQPTNVLPKSPATVRLLVLVESLRRNQHVRVDIRRVGNGRSRPSSRVV